MCGIAGKISFDSKPVTTADVRRMVDVLHHRGPDDSGVYLSEDRHVGLGHSRLAIIDLSPAGHQPMHYLSRYTITFNGEIYNYQSERQQLAAQGYQFQSHTDTEVILALYDKYGVDCLSHLRGMFAFAIYDKQAQTLFCARDRVGKKPFKYFHHKNVFIFASELKAILTQSEYQRQPDMAAIHHFLTYQYVPAPQTGFVDIKKLPPAHYLLLNCATGQAQIQRYWQLDYRTTLDLSEREWGRRIMAGAEEAVALRMISDVPIGAFLSGGVDSSAVVGLMSKLSSQPVKTFSIGFTESSHSEVAFARQVANHFHTDHTEFIMQPDAMADVPALVEAFEEPYADASALPTYYVSKLARQHVTVALNGDGGDENFAGYDRYRLQKLMLWLDANLPAPLHQLVKKAAIAGERIPYASMRKIAQLIKHIDEPYPSRYGHLISFFSNQAKNSIYTDSWLQQTANHNSLDMLTDKFHETGTPDRLSQTLYADIMTYLPDALLTKVDIASMAVSLEARSPLLDHKFMELTAQIPSHLKLKGVNQTKYIFKQALQGFLPQEILNRPKMGFGVPVNHWFRHELKDYVTHTLTSPQAVKRNLFKPDAIKTILHTHTTGQQNRGHELWALLMLELWFKKFFD